MSSICCGIVTYNPDIKRLETNISAIKNQTEKTCVYDNGSKNISEIIQLCKKHNCNVINSGTNSGMAVALNALANIAIANDFQYIVFLDQDSVAKPRMVEALKSLDQNMVKEALIPRFLDCFYAGCKDDELKAYVDSVVASK